jgi:hypothetical protein
VAVTAGLVAGSSSIVDSVGNLNFSGATVAGTLNAKATVGQITQTGAMSTGALIADAATGIALTNTANALGTLTASNSTSGAITVNNGSNLSLSDVGNSAATGAVSITLAATKTMTQISNSSISANGGDITLSADTMALGSKAGGNDINAGVGAVQIVPTTVSRTIRLGQAGDSVGNLDLSGVELDTVTAAKLIIGSATTTGAIQVFGAPVVLTNAIGALSLLTEGGNITVQQALTLDATTALVMSTQAGGVATTGLISQSASAPITASSINATANTGINLNAGNTA